MEITTLRETSHPDKLVCESARNDYLDGWVGEMDYEDIMDPVSPDQEDRETAQRVIEDVLPWYPSEESLAQTCRLIRKLMEPPGHFGPFEHPHVTFAVKGVSRITMAQLTRHRHVSFDVQSMRYVEFDEDPEELAISIPEIEDAGLHGRRAEYSEEYADKEEDWILGNREETYEQAIKYASATYERLLDLGVAPENARAVLPIGTKVNMVFTMNLRSLMHIADMRAAGDAQWEIRELTEELLDVAEEWAPVTMKTYEEHLKNRKNRIAP